MDGKFKARWSRIEKTANDVLVAANGCLAIVAILLVSLMFIELEMASWRVDDASAGMPTTIDMRYTPS